MDAVARGELDLADAGSVATFDFSPYGTIVNAAAMTAVDHAETPEGRREAWAANVDGVRRLVDAARAVRARLVQVSSDYVFDGEREVHDEAEPFSPLGVYGQTKAAADAIVAGYVRGYVVRTSWVVGDGRNFVATMAALAEKGVDPSLVDDQIGRLTFTEDLAAAIDHLLASGAEAGTYNVTCSGEPRSWAQIARSIFALVGADPERVTPVSTAEYSAGKTGLAPRPMHSTLALDKITAVGFEPRVMDQALKAHLRAQAGT